VSAEEELRRVLPVIDGLISAGVAAEVSIDTYKAAVAVEAARAGATIVNDVTALRGDPEMASVVAASGVGCCLMHMLGEPRTMQDDPRYHDVVDEVKAFLAARMELAIAAGIAPGRIMVDPGIGFGKTLAHNLELLRRMDELVALGPPVVIGTSRKSFLGKITAKPVEDRIAATIATNVFAYMRGARVFRVHDAAPIHDALAITAATVSPPWASTTPTNSTLSTT
jgi:dihydropteroate synthase